MPALIAGVVVALLVSAAILRRSWATKSLSSLATSTDQFRPL